MILKGTYFRLPHKLKCSIWELKIKYCAYMLSAIDFIPLTFCYSYVNVLLPVLSH